MASMSTAKRMEVPAANVSSRVSTYIPPWGMEGESLRPPWLEMATDCYVYANCPTCLEPSFRMWVTGLWCYCADVTCSHPYKGLLESLGLRVGTVASQRPGGFQKDFCLSSQ